MKEEPEVSFIIPAYNEQELIGSTITAINAAAAGLCDYEIVVSDDASDDDTAAIASAAGARVVPTNNRQIAATRNAGAAAAKGQFFVFVDADTIVPRDLFEATLNHYRNGGIAGGGRCQFEGTIPLWFKILGPVFMWLYFGSRLTPGAYLFTTREAFNSVGGFDDTQFGGEEVLLSRALDRFCQTKGRRFTILDQHIVTSGRKLRSHSGWEVLRTMWFVIRHKGKSRSGMDIWYGPRREDPAST